MILKRRFQRENLVPVLDAFLRNGTDELAHLPLLVVVLKKGSRLFECHLEAIVEDALRGRFDDLIFLVGAPTVLPPDSIPRQGVARNEFETGV